MGGNPDQIVFQNDQRQTWERRVRAPGLQDCNFVATVGPGALTRRSPSGVFGGDK